MNSIEQTTSRRIGYLSRVVDRSNRQLREQSADRVQNFEERRFSMLEPPASNRAQVVGGSRAEPRSAGPNQTQGSRGGGVGFKFRVELGR